jgi:hypothetical protein
MMLFEDGGKSVSREICSMLAMNPLAQIPNDIKGGTTKRKSCGWWQKQ